MNPWGDGDDNAMYLDWSEADYDSFVRSNPCPCGQDWASHDGLCSQCYSDQQILRRNKRVSEGD